MLTHFLRYIGQFKAKICVLSFFTILSFTTFAQSQKIKDSLFLELRYAKTDIERIGVLNALAYEHYDFDDSIAFYYAKRALILAKNVDYPKGLQYAYTMVGVGYFSFGDYDKALQNFSEATSIPYKETDYDHLLYNLTLTGNILADIGRYDSAQKIFDKGLKIAFENKNIKRQANIYKAIARMQTRLWKNEEALHNLKKADSLRQNESLYNHADISYIYALAYLNKSDFENANKHIQDLCKSVENIDDNFHNSLCFLMRSQLNSLNGQYSIALADAFQALEITEIYTYPYLRAQIFIQIGYVYYSMGEYPIALEFLFRGLKITEKSGIDPLTVLAYTKLGLIFKEQKNYPLSLDYTNRAEKLFEKMADIRGIGNTHNNRGLVYTLQKKYEESLVEHEKALAIQQSINNQVGLANSFFNMAVVYEGLGDYTKALALRKKAMELDEVIGLPIDINISYLGVANLLVKLDRIEEANFYLKKSTELVEKTKSKTIQRENFDAYSKYYEAQGEFKKAFEFAQKFRIINDSIFSENSSMKIAEMQSLYDVERKEQQIALLSKESDLQSNQLALQKAQLTNQNIIIITGSITLLLIASVLFFIVQTNRKLTKAKRDLAEMNEELMTQSEELRESNESLVEVYTKLLKQQDEIQQQAEELRATNNDLEGKRNEIEAQAEELREANETISTINQHLEEKVDERTEQLKQAYIELDTFFYRSSHDFRRPITTFIGLAEVAKITSKDENTLELFSKVKETALSLDRMIRKLQTISDVGAQKMVYKEILIPELITNILDSQSDELNAKQIKVIKEIELKESFYSYGALINVIMENLIENAIQFATPKDPYVKIRATTTKTAIVLQVEDNGQGIPSEYHERVFDMYFRASISSKGNGLGLYIVKKAVDKLEGTIRFETNFNEGTNFIVELPVKEA